MYFLFCSKNLESGNKFIDRKVVHDYEKDLFDRTQFAKSSTKSETWVKGKIFKKKILIDQV